MWRFWRDGIEFVFHLSYFHPTRFDWKQALLLPPVRGMALPERRVCSLLPHALAHQLFPIFLTCRALGPTYWGLVWPRWEENKSIWSQGQSVVLASELCLSLVLCVQFPANLALAHPCRDVGCWHFPCHVSPWLTLLSNPWQSLFGFWISRLDLNFLTTILNIVCLFNLRHIAAWSSFPFSFSFPSLFPIQREQVRVN